MQSCLPQLTFLQLVGDAIVGVIFVRNVLSVAILFSMTPWIEAMGLQYMIVLLALITLTINMGFPILLLMFGKRARQSTITVFGSFARQEVTTGADSGTETA
jgi:hypothetical protein